MKTKSLFGKCLLMFLGVSFSLGISILPEGALHLNSTLFASAAAANEAVSPAAPAACPAATISGTVGSGSPDHPFVTGNQTSRLFRNSVESTCGTPKPTPSLTDVGTQFKFDAFSFTNNSASSVCITVITTPTANGQLLAAAYLNSFNPGNVQQNYLGDAGDSDGTHGFSFIVPANSNFVVVQSRVNTAANPPSLAYSFNVLGLPGCNSCPPKIISGTIGSGSTQWPAAIDTQQGRLFRDSVASACSPAKPVPSVTDATSQFTYDAYTFLNPSASSICVTVNTTAGAPNQVLTAAYLDRYNRLDVQENYLGDAGNSDQSRTFSFTVPAKRSFVIVQSRVNTAANPPSLGYFFSVSGVPGCVSCVPIDIAPDTIPNARLGQPYSQQLTRTGGTSPVVWSIIGSLPNGLSLNSSTGLLSGTPTVSGNFNFNVRVTDANGCLGEIRYFLQVVNCPVIDITPSALASATVGVSYNQQLTATAGTPTFTFSLLAGSLPPGLALSSGGLISGTLTSANSTNFTVKVTDTFGCTGTRTYTIIGCNVVTINPTTAANGFVGAPYSQNFSQTGGAGTITWSISAGSLPPGLTQNTSSGLISGTPTTVGTFNFTVRATSFNGCFGERSYTVIISGNGLMFYPLPRPIRLMDTRAGQGNCDNISTPIAAGTSLTTPARTTCEGINIPQGAQAVVGNLTVINQSPQAGFLTIYPDGVPVPLANNMIYYPGQIIANNFTVGLSGAGKFNVFGERTIDVVIDISGYFAPPGAGGLYYHPLARPVRLLDTRPNEGNCDNVSTPIAAGTSLTTLARTACEGLNIPQSAQAIVANSTVINGSGQVGFLTIYPNGVPVPLASNMVYFPGQILSNAFTVSLSGGGEFNIFAERQIDMVVDVAGYYSTEATDANGQGLLFTPLARPLRILDTRPGQGNCDNVSAPIAGGTFIAAPGRLTCESITIPAVAQTLLGNMTVINQTLQAGYLTLYPDGLSVPLASNMVYFPGQLLSNAFVVGLSAPGDFDIFAERTVDAIVDIGGYFAP